MAADDIEDMDAEQLIEELSKITTQGTVEYLGRCVVAWSTAERCLETLLIVLLSGRGLPVKDAQVVVANLDLRERARVTVGLAYKAGLPRARLLHIQRLVNRIQDDLRNRRNRLLHDSWSLGSGLILKRASTGTKLVQPQSFRLELLVPDYEPVQPAVLADFIRDCLEVATAMADEAQHVLDQAARHLPATQRPESGEQSPRPPTIWSGVLRRFRSVLSRLRR